MLTQITFLFMQLENNSTLIKLRGSKFWAVKPRKAINFNVMCVL